MPLFAYKAADGAGKIVTGKIEAGSAQAVAETLLRKGMSPLRARKVSALNMDISDLARKDLDFRSLALFCSRLSFFLGTGMLLPEAIRAISSQAKDKRLKKMLAGVQNSVLEGKPLSECMKAAPVPALVPALCHVGEESGKLAESVGQMAKYYEREYKNRREMAGMLIYPAVIGAMTLAVCVLAVIYVIPNYAAVFQAEGVKLPAPTRLMVALSGALVGGWPLLVCGVALAAALVYAFFATKQGKKCAGFVKAHIPLWRLGMCARFCQCSSMLFSAGLPAPDAVNIAREAIGNPYLDGAFLRMASGLKQGKELSAVLAESKRFDDMVVQMAEMGEKTGSLATPMSQCADYYQVEQERASAIYSKLAEPMIMLVLGAVLGLIMLSVILPTFELINAF